MINPDGEDTATRTTSPATNPSKMKKHFFPVMLACFVIEFGGFVTLAIQGREPVKALILAGLMIIPIFYIIKRMKNPKFNPLKNF